MDLLQQLQVFVAIADNGSFARAADALGMGRPTITNTIAALEASIGARLLHRTTRRTTLTSEGELFYERAARLLADAQETRNLFGGPGQMPRGRLRIDVPVALAKPFIIPHLPDFMRRYPEIDLILGVSDQPADLLADGIDCVLRLGDLAVSSMVGRVVGHVRMVTCGAPTYLAEYGTPRTLDDLASHRAVTYFAGRSRRTIDWHFTVDGEVRTVRMRPGILVNETEAFIACALAGMGLIQAIGAGVEEHLKAGRLVEVLPEMKTVERPVSIMYPNRLHLAPQVRVFIDWIAVHFSSLEGQWIKKV